MILIKFILLFTIILILSFQTEAAWSPLGFSFTHKGDYLNFPKDDWNVYGIRTNFFGASHKKVIGLDFGGLNITKEVLYLRTTVRSF